MMIMMMMIQYDDDHYDDDHGIIMHDHDDYDQVNLVPICLID